MWRAPDAVWHVGEASRASSLYESRYQQQHEFESHAAVASPEGRTLSGGACLLDVARTSISLIHTEFAKVPIEKTQLLISGPALCWSRITAMRVVNTFKASANETKCVSFKAPNKLMCPMT